MLKLLLADDEPVILQGMAKLIPWDKYGIEIIGEAYDGDELLQAILERSPDIVVTDISMPGLNGTDVLKRLKELGMPTKVIFISAYQEFAYAQDAISYGAVDYLVKPIDRNKLEAVVSKTVSLIRQESEQMSKQNKLIVYEKQMWSRTIQELADRLTDGEKVSAQALGDTFGETAGCRFAVIAAYHHSDPEHAGSWKESERKLVQFAMQNVMEEVIGQSAQGWVVGKGERMLAIIQQEGSDREGVSQVACRIRESLERFLKIRVTVSVGSSLPLEKASESYAQARMAEEFAYFAGSGRVYDYDQPPSVPDGEPSNLDTLEKELAKSVLVSQSGRMDELLDSFLDTILILSWGNRDYAVNLCYTMLLSLFRELEQVGFDYRSGKEEQRLLGRQLGLCDSFAGLCTLTRNELAKAEAAVSGSEGGKEKRQILQLKEYINTHYAEDINLDKMASVVYMNSYYFSGFFKKHTGQNFKQYLTEVRLKNALQLLQQTDLMVYEIAEKVGYNNARQFSDMFKKQYGKLPNEWRQK